jgi:Protein of unknown function (DUF3300)
MRLNWARRVRVPHAEGKLSTASVVVAIVLTLVPYSGSAAVLVQAKPAQAAPAPTPAKPSPQTLDGLLAPVALYPDQLLTQMLLSTKEPAKIQELSGWLVRNAELTGTALQRSAEAAGFEPSLVVLTMFPQVVNFMADNIDWTKELGQAFAVDREGVLNSVQRLRADAQKSGALKSTPQQTVQTKTTTTGEQVIVIEPANPQVVYVPQYNPQAVYTAPPTTTTQTVVIKEEDNSGEAAAMGAIVGFAAGIAIGAAMDNDYYYGPYGWHGGGYMYNDSWNDFYDDREDAREDFYDHREDSREDWQDHREDIADERGDRSGTTQQQRTEAQQNRQATRGEGTTATSQRATSGATASTTGATSAATRGKSSGDRQSASQRSGGGSDAFSGYSSGGSERSASSRGRSSRASSGGGRSGGGGRRR